MSMYDKRAEHDAEIFGITPKMQSLCEKHDLFPSGESIEDMGVHWYIVRKCEKSWLS